jgi:hypothetical protein
MLAHFEHVAARPLRTRYHACLSALLRCHEFSSTTDCAPADIPDDLQKLMPIIFSSRAWRDP